MYVHIHIIYTHDCMNIHRHPGVDSNRQHIKNNISSLTLEYLCKSMSISPHQDDYRIIQIISMVTIG